MILSEANGGTEGEGGLPNLSAAAAVREAGEDFSASFSRMQDAVRKACTGHSEWEAKVAAGIRATLEFAAAHPGQAEALTIKARHREPERVDPERDVITHFAELLAEVAPSHRLFPISTNESIVEAIAIVIRGHLLDGTAGELPGKAVDLIYLALIPFLGLEGTRRRIDELTLSWDQGTT